MFSYNIAKEADNKAFQSACVAIEANIKDLEKEKLLIDADGTLVQIYHVQGRKIKVVNDYEVDAVYADSDVNLSNIL